MEQQGHIFLKLEVMSNWWSNFSNHRRMFSETKSNEKPNLLHIQGNSPEQAFPSCSCSESMLAFPTSCLSRTRPLDQQKHSPCLTLFSQTLTNTNSLTGKAGYPAFCWASLSQFKWKKLLSFPKIRAQRKVTQHNIHYSTGQSSNKMLLHMHAEYK